MAKNNSARTQGQAAQPNANEVALQIAALQSRDTNSAMANISAERARQARQGRKRTGSDETVPGGQYIVDGVWVDAYGNEIEPELDDPNEAEDPEKTPETEDDTNNGGQTPPAPQTPIHPQV